MPSQVSVIVPTRDRPAALSECLDALSRQTAADRLDVIVVDDGSTAANDVASIVARHPRARLLRASGGGPAAARNLGAGQAHGSILCFTDDDCVPHADWVERLADEIDRGADGAAGTTLSAGGALADASEIVARAPAGVPPPHGGTLRFAASNNLACSAAVFQSAPFDESFPTAAAEDREWCERFAASGYALRFVPAACVVHQPDLTLSSFLGRQVRYGEGAYRLRMRRGAPVRLEPAGFYVALIRHGFAQGLATGLLVGAAQVATAFGFLAGWAAQQRDGGATRDRPDGSTSGGDAP